MNRKRRVWSSVMGTSLAAATLSLGLPTDSVSASYLAEIASQSPLLFWEMNEAAVTNPFPATLDNLAAQLPGYTNNGNVGTNIVFGIPSLTAANGFPGFQAGNTAYNFNSSGAGSVITTLTNPLNSLTMVGSSISMWVRSTNPNASGTMNGTLWRGDEGSGHNLSLRLSDDVNGNGTLGLYLEDAEGAGPSGTFVLATDGSVDYSDGQWHHVAGAWSYDINTDAGVLTVYIDGGSLAGGAEVSVSFSKADYGPITFETDPINNPGVFEVMDFDFRNRIGKGRVNAHRYNGEIDETAIWNRVLSAQEVADQYQSAVPEPASLALLACGVGFIGQRRMMKRS